MIQGLNLQLANTDKKLSLGTVIDARIKIKKSNEQSTFIGQ